MAKNNINLYILNATGRLKSFYKQIGNSFEVAIVKVSNIIPIRDIDVAVIDNPRATIPEVGVGGYTYNGNFILISLDPGLPDFENKVFREQLRRVLVHELSHAIRFKTVGYGKTLLEALVSEGLADYFEGEITNKGPNPWSVAFNKSQIEQMTKRAEKEYGNKNYHHNEWFFGSKENGIPRWTGYTLGYNLIAEYLKKNPSKKPSQLHFLKAEEFIK